MNNQEFIKYTSQRYGIDENTIETMVDIFASSLQEVITSGNKVTIDEIGEFCPEITQDVRFKPSQKLCKMWHDKDDQVILLSS